ncbi:hypothetical protein Glove_23g68 [Diversispora epigaea]|uniref:Uncharacterized protein n=1 Tax=Diversispora epigaea TaxID=1348612 RepID=A0A397JT06_9GLOM|nr:hypothetical protein Glove_23g68 [Diversispora epigaea]
MFKSLLTIKGPRPRRLPLPTTPNTSTTSTTDTNTTTTNITTTDTTTDTTSTDITTTGPTISTIDTATTGPTTSTNSSKPAFSILKETVTTSHFTCNVCKVDTSVNTSIHDKSAITTVSDPHPNIFTTFTLTNSIPPISTITVLIPEVTTPTLYAVVPTITTNTSNASDSINYNLNVWKYKLNRMIIYLWAIGVAFVYKIFA